MKSLHLLSRGDQKTFETGERELRGSRRAKDEPQNYFSKSALRKTREVRAVLLSDGGDESVASGLMGWAQIKRKERRGIY